MFSTTVKFTQEVGWFLSTQAPKGAVTRGKVSCNMQRLTIFMLFYTFYKIDTRKNIQKYSEINILIKT